jgi:hypothetical protein
MKGHFITFYHGVMSGRILLPMMMTANFFLDTVGEMGERFELGIYAYVLLDNHYHLLFRTHRANLCRCMQWFGATHTKRFNLLHNRNSHLF